MDARLNAAYGWRWQYEDGNLGPFILYDVERYAGMVSGWTLDGRKCARPVCEIEALRTKDGPWLPTSSLLAQVPQEGHASRVRIRDVCLPMALDEDP